MDETPEHIPEELRVGAPAELDWASADTAPLADAPPVGNPVTAKSLWRDAALDLLVALGCGFGIGLVMALTAVFVGGLRVLQRVGESPWLVVGFLVATQLPFPFIALRRRRRNREKQRPVMDLFEGPTGPAIRRGVAAGFAMTVVSILYTLLVQRVLGQDSVQNQLDFMKALLDHRGVVVVLVTIIAILGPVGEELFFRGAIFGSARAAGFSKVGVVISAVFFSAVHLSATLVPFYATFAVVMCWLYARTGTLAAPIAAHMTMNSMACLALLIAGDGTV